MLPHPMTLNASYQITQPGAAYVFSTTFIPSGWNITMMPNAISFMYGSLTFTWILYNAYDWISKTMSVLKMTVVSFTCIHSNQGSLMVYAGMLTLYQTRWTDHQITKVQCNTMTETSIDLSFHMYMTMVVTIPAADHSAQLNVTLQTTRVHFLETLIPVTFSQD